MPRFKTFLKRRTSKNAISGKASDVTASMDLTGLPGEKLDVKVKIRPSPTKDWNEIE